MKRSPFLLLAGLCFSCTLFPGSCNLLAWSQSNSPQPQPASGALKTPLSGDSKLNSPAGQPGAAVSQGATAGTANNAAAASEDVAVEPLVSLSGASASSRASTPPPQPKTEILDSSAAGSALNTDGHDPILDPPPLPQTNTTLVGGIVRAVDHIHNRMTIAVFAGDRWKIAFDERTHIFRNDAETTQTVIKKGERVYVDTMLDPQKHQVFARNIRVGLASPTADADGQVTSLDAERGAVTLRDQINSSPIRFQVDNSTRIVYGSRPASLRDLKPGSLVHVRFSPEQSNRGIAREVTIVAAPGAAFTYVGKITYLDVHRGQLAIEDSLDQKTYDVHFDPATVQSRNDLAVGSEVRVVAIFEGARYNAQSITLTKSAAAAEKE